jgi:hypothetical protein
MTSFTDPSGVIIPTTTDRAGVIGSEPLIAVNSHILPPIPRENVQGNPGFWGYFVLKYYCWWSCALLKIPRLRGVDTVKGPEVIPPGRSYF